MLIEPSDIIMKAKQGSKEYYGQGMAKRGLTIDASDEEILQAWKLKLLNN